MWDIEVVQFNWKAIFSWSEGLWKAIELTIMPVKTILKNMENLPFYSQFIKMGHYFFTPFINVTNICCRQCLMNDCRVVTVADYGLLLDKCNVFRGIGREFLIIWSSWFFVSIFCFLGQLQLIYCFPWLTGTNQVWILLVSFGCIIII